MELPLLAIYTVTAFVCGFFAAAIFIRWVISLDRIKEDGAHRADEHYPDVRRSLHYARQELFGVLAALIVIAGFLAAIVVVLMFKH
jgi:hypothetical protein